MYTRIKQPPHEEDQRNLHEEETVPKIICGYQKVAHKVLNGRLPLSTGKRRLTVVLPNDISGHGEPGRHNDIRGSVPCN